MVPKEDSQNIIFGFSYGSLPVYQDFFLKKKFLTTDYTHVYPPGKEIIPVEEMDISNPVPENVCGSVLL